jgi:hypothetical protein
VVGHVRAYVFLIVVCKVNINNQLLIIN